MNGDNTNDEWYHPHGNKKIYESYSMGNFIGEESRLDNKPIKKYTCPNKPKGRWKKTWYGVWYQGRSPNI